jgi:biopolymer transport protein ExbB
MVEMFINGGLFMWPILILLILGLAISIERLWTLTRAGVNTRKFLDQVKSALKEGGVEKALEVCSTTRGPVASIFHAGLMRADRGVESVEKAVTSAGSIEMAFLEKGLVWLATIISVAPMLGFTGTVQGMIQAFDAIAAANDISPTIVASGISVALLTTLFGLVVAMIIQVLHYLEESSNELVDTLVANEKK